MSNFAERSARIKALREQGNLGLSYNVQISEHQRRLLVRALQQLLVNEQDILIQCESEEEIPIGAQGNQFEEAKWLFQQFHIDIPKQERETPGITYGLCL